MQLKNQQFFVKICKYALYESSEGLFGFAESQPALRTLCFTDNFPPTKDIDTKNSQILYISLINSQNSKKN